MTFKQNTEQSGESLVLGLEGSPPVNQNGGAGTPCMRQAGERKPEEAEALTRLVAFVLSTVQGQCLVEGGLKA